ncbi:MULTISPECIES: hypothetical protein [Sphingobacterium]|nr:MULTISPECIES: hypothetical protein [Sphingobacterium]QQT44553.1 hypothetical protein I6J00_23015 [Sphingobacterium multivorum]
MAGTKLSYRYVSLCCFFAFLPMKHRRNTKEIADEAQANPKEDPNKEQRNTKEPAKNQQGISIAISLKILFFN